MPTDRWQNLQQMVSRARQSKCQAKKRGYDVAPSQMRLDAALLARDQAVAQFIKEDGDKTRAAIVASTSEVKSHVTQEANDLKKMQIELATGNYKLPATAHGGDFIRSQLKAVRDIQNSVSACRQMMKESKTAIKAEKQTTKPDVDVQSPGGAAVQSPEDAAVQHLIAADSGAASSSRAPAAVVAQQEAALAEIDTQVLQPQATKPRTTKARKDHDVSEKFGLVSVDGFKELFAGKRDTTTSPDVPISKKARRVKATKMHIDPSGVQLVPESMAHSMLEHGPCWAKLSDEQRGVITTHMQHRVLPDELLQPVTDFINSMIPQVKVHRQARKHNLLEERPKYVWAIAHPIHGGFGVYIWKQEMEDYGMVSAAPEIIVKLMKYMSQECNEEFNHCMLTLHVDGTCGIPAHSDKVFTKESPTAIERVCTIADISLGATRKFMIVEPTAEGEDMASLEEHRVVSIDMTHGSFLSMAGSMNADFNHCVPLQPEVAAPRVSLVFRRVDKKYIHPSEDMIRLHSAKDWSPIKNSKGRIVKLRRQMTPEVEVEDLVEDDL